MHVLKAPVNDLILRFDDGEPVPVEQGIAMRRYYERITAESATGQAVVILAGFGSSVDGRATASVNVTTNIAPGNALDDGGDVTVPDDEVTQLLAADPDRLYINVDLPSDAPGPIRVGSASVDGTKGRRIEPGMSVPIATTAALYAYQDNGEAVTVSVSAVKES